MKKLIINLLAEWIEEKEERILNLEHDKAIYHWNYRY
nr:MAG TPA: Tetracycline resistance determinant leader peptide [Caudoviricetes sp.]